MYFLVKVSTLASFRPNAIAPLIDYTVNIPFILTGKPNKLYDNYNHSNIHSMVVNESYSVVSNSLRSHGPYSPWNSVGQNTGVGSLSLFQGILTTQKSNRGLLHCRWILYQWPEDKVRWEPGWPPSQNSGKDQAACFFIWPLRQRSQGLSCWPTW